jgi:hypothetical protein
MSTELESIWQECVAVYQSAALTLVSMRWDVGPDPDHVLDTQDYFE